MRAMWLLLVLTLAACTADVTAPMPQARAVRKPVAPLPIPATDSLPHAPVPATF